MSELIFVSELNPEQIKNEILEVLPEAQKFISLMRWPSSALAPLPVDAPEGLDLEGYVLYPVQAKRRSKTLVETIEADEIAWKIAVPTFDPGHREQPPCTDLDDLDFIGSFSNALCHVARERLDEELERVMEAMYPPPY